jgi:hypothetical protein
MSFGFGRDDKGVFVNFYELQLSVSETFPGLVIKSEAEGPAVFLLATIAMEKMGSPADSESASHSYRNKVRCNNHRRYCPFTTKL